MTPDSIRTMLVDLERVRTLAKRCMAPENVHTVKWAEGPPSTYMSTGKLTGELRRASMDLTRSLASMRHP